MANKQWKTRDPLYRGDGSSTPAAPVPGARCGVVEHILFLGGRGRATPFSSTTESGEVAEYFAGPSGQVWQTEVATATGEGAAHLSRKQLLQDLRGFGKGRAKWKDAWEVAQAAAYVTQWSEHLLDWSGLPVSTMAGRLGRTFRKRK